MRVILERAHLDAPCDLERGLAMSTLIANEEWTLEAEWTGVTLGDIVLYRDMSKSSQRGMYFGSVPAARVKSYRFLNGEPETGAHAIRAELPKGGQRATT